MKLYFQDIGYRGSIVTIAENEDEARKQMKKDAPNYDEEGRVDCHEVVLGKTLYNLGDM